MTNIITNDTWYKNIGNAIRTKNGTTNRYKPSQMDEAILAIEGEVFPHAEIPAYVKNEALAVAAKVKAAQEVAPNNVTCLMMSDTHAYINESNNWQEQTNVSALHASQAAQILSYVLNLDFCVYLGDYGIGSTVDYTKEQIKTISKYLDSNFKGIPQFRTVGNHDTGVTGEALLDLDYLYSTIMEKNTDATFGSDVYGYCYRDLTDKKIRVIVLNTEEGESTDGYSAPYLVSPAQRLWFAQTLYDVGSKTDAAEWGIIVLGHYPLDYSAMYYMSNIVYAYVNGTSTTENKVTINFDGHNLATFIANFHGHLHNFLVDNLRKVVDNSGTAFNAKRICVPNAGFYRNNYATPSYWGADFFENTTYNKTANTAEDTAFIVNVIDLDEKVIHSFCYGAGIDRVISYGAVTYYSIVNNLTNVTNSNEATSAEENTAYSATLTANTGYNLGTVTITMGGTDITSTAYNNGSISITNVTGNIIITAVATKIVNYTNQVTISTDADGNVYNTVGYKDGYRINSSGAEAEYSGYTATGFIPFTKGQTIRIGGEGITYDSYGCVLMCYDTSKTVIANVGIGYDKVGNTNYGTWTTEKTSVFCLDPVDNYPSTFSGDNLYIRISAKGSGANLIVTLDEKID